MIALEAETLVLVGESISIARKLGVTGTGKIQSGKYLRLGAVYSENLDIVH